MGRRCAGVNSGTSCIAGRAGGEGAGPFGTTPHVAPGEAPVLAILAPAPLRRPTRQLFTATVAVVGVGLAMGKRLGIA